MNESAPLTADELIRQRERHYNARVDQMLRVHEELLILRVVPDDGVQRFIPGQYTTLGLGIWEPRIDGFSHEIGAGVSPTRIIKRAYSVSCPLLLKEGRPLAPSEYPYLEFYISLVRRSEAGPPMLTPRLFQLREGDRLQCGPHFHGHYTSDRIKPEQQVLFAATGTGEAPHNALLAEMLARGHCGPLVSAVCVGWRRDLAYLDAHRRLEEQYKNYCYLPLTTREAVNLDSTAPGYIGKRYLQAYVESGALERDAGLILSPGNTHVFLCGNPEMIGIPHHTHHPSHRYPTPRGMVEVLERRGFSIDQPHAPGNIHFEKYW